MLQMGFTIHCRHRQEKRVDYIYMDIQIQHNHRATFHFLPRRGGASIVSVALSVPRKCGAVDVIHHSFLWSPDFPPRRSRAAGRLPTYPDIIKI